MCEFLRDKIRERVHDPEIAELLCPYDHPLGTKRMCVDTGYFETYNRPNVRLVSIRETPIEEITETGLRVAGEEFTFDTIVLGTGFDAMTGALLAVDLRGRDGLSLREKWADGPRSSLGLTIAGFPNLFTVTGPGSPSVLSNMMVSIEQHVDWIVDCIAHLREHGIATIEPSGRDRGRVGRPRPRGRRREPLPAREVVVHGREHPRQAARAAAVRRRRRGVSRDLRGRRRAGLRRIRPAPRRGLKRPRYFGSSTKISQARS